MLSVKLSAIGEATCKIFCSEDLASEHRERQTSAKQTLKCNSRLDPVFIKQRSHAGYQILHQLFGVLFYFFYLLVKVIWKGESSSSILINKKILQQVNNLGKLSVIYYIKVCVWYVSSHSEVSLVIPSVQ